MKKRFWFILAIIFLSFNIVNAKNSFDVSSITDNCHIVTKNTTVIPIKVIVLNNGSISSAITSYKLGTIENISAYKYQIKNFKSDYVADISIDSLRDASSMSDVNYKIKEDTKVIKGQTLMSFDLEVEFNGEYPNTLDILGNEIILSDKKTCATINGYETEVISKEVPVYLEDSVNYFFFIVISIVLLLATFFLLIVIILRRKAK